VPFRQDRCGVVLLRCANDLKALPSATDVRLVVQILTLIQYAMETQTARGVARGSLDRLLPPGTSSLKFSAKPSPRKWLNRFSSNRGTRDFQNATTTCYIMERPSGASDKVRGVSHSGRSFHAWASQVDYGCIIHGTTNPLTVSLNIRNRSDGTDEQN
jgi:hypothetical protein